MQEALPKTDDFKMKLCRNAVIGFSASAISDTVSNSVRVIKVGAWLDHGCCLDTSAHTCFLAWIVGV